VTIYSATWVKTDANQILRRAGAAADFDHVGDFSSASPWKWMRRCCAADDGTINAFYGQSGYSDTGENGQACTYLPLFYSALSADVSGNITWSVSDDASDVDLNGVDVQPNPAFVRGSTNSTANPLVMPYILLGSFIGSITGAGSTQSPYMIESKASTVAAPVRPYRDTAANLAAYATARSPVFLVPTNLLTTNQANGTESGATYPDFGTGYGGGTVASSTLTAAGWPFQGARSLKFTTHSPAAAHSSVYSAQWSNYVAVPTANATYTVSFYAYAPDNPDIWLEILMVEQPDSSYWCDQYLSSPFQVPGTPTRFAFSVPFTHSCMYSSFYMRTPTGYDVAGDIVYFDGFQFEEFPSGYSYPSNLPPGYYNIAPGGAPSAWHIGSVPAGYRRPATGWGMMTARAYAAVQLLRLVEQAQWEPSAYPGQATGLISYPVSTQIGSDPGPTNFAYNGYTGSYGIEQGNTSGVYWPPHGLPEMFASTPADFGKPSVVSYRGIEHPDGNATLCTEGAIFYIGEGGDYRLYVADDNYTWDGEGYIDAGLSLGASTGGSKLSTGYATDFVIGATQIGGVTQNWFFLPKDPALGGTRGQTYNLFSVGVNYPSPMCVSSQYDYTHQMYGVFMGHSFTSPYYYGTRLQYTPTTTV
jgi:hypothetical protein